MAKLQHLHVVQPMLNFCHCSKGNSYSFSVLTRKSVWRAAGLEDVCERLCGGDNLIMYGAETLFMDDMRENFEITCVVTDG